MVRDAREETMQGTHSGGGRPSAVLRVGEGLFVGVGEANAST